MVGPMRLSTNIVLARLFSAPYLYIKGLASDYSNDIDDTETQKNILFDRINEYIQYHENRIENITSSTLTDILNDWIDERRFMNDLSEEEIDRTTTDILYLIDEVHEWIEYVIRDVNRLDSIQYYMSEYNNRLFDVLSGRDPESIEPRDLHSLDNPYIELLVNMRWIQDSDSDVGITVYDLVNNFDSITVNHRMRQYLESVLE